MIAVACNGGNLSVENLCNGVQRKEVQNELLSVLQKTPQLQGTERPGSRKDLLDTRHRSLSSLQQPVPLTRQDLATGMDRFQSSVFIVRRAVFIQREQGSVNGFQPVMPGPRLPLPGHWEH